MNFHTYTNDNYVIPLMKSKLRNKRKIRNNSNAFIAPEMNDKLNIRLSNIIAPAKISKK